VKLQDWKATKSKILLIGESGTGKSSQAATIARVAKKVWVASFDAGVASMKSTLLRTGLKDVDIEVDTFIEIDRKVPSAYKNFLKVFGERKTQGFDAYVFDNISFFSQAIFDDIVAVNNLVDKPYGDSTFHMYRLLADKMKDVITNAIMLSNYVVCTALPLWEKDDNSGEMHVFPLVEGKFRQSLPAWFDELYYTVTSTDTKTGKPVYQMLTAPQGKYVAKSRWGGAVLKPVEDRDLGEIVQVITAAHEPQVAKEVVKQ